MADILKLSRLLNGVIKTVDISSNSLVTQSIKVGGSVSNTELTKSILDKLILIHNAADADGTFDTRYYTQTQVDNLLAAQDDASEITYTPAQLASWSGSADPGNADAALDQLASRLTTAEGTLSTDVIKKDGSIAFTANQSMGGFKLTSLGTPTDAGDAVTKAYVDAIKQGLDVKDSVRVATTANIADLAAGAPSTVDGVSLSAGDRVLVKDQSTGSQNGIYVVDTVGTGSDGSWSRASDADSDADVTTGMFTFVSEGTANADSGWVLTTNDPITLDTTALSFTQFSGAGQIEAGSALTKTGNTLNWNPDDVTLEVSGDQARIKAGGITDTHINASAAIQTSKLADSAELSEAVTFFASTDLSAAEAEQLSDGSNADTLHEHAKVVKTFTAGEGFSANTTYAVRIALSGETAGRVYAADYDASSTDTYYAIGFIEGNGATAKIAGDPVKVVLTGEITLGSSDTAFAAGEAGEPVHLLASGGFDALSQITYSTDQASYRLGMVLDTNKIWVGDRQLLGIA